MKAVCILLQNYYDGDIRVRRKAEALACAGYVVDVLALRPSKSEKSAYVLNGVNVYTVALGKKRGSQLRYILEYLAFFFWAAFRASVLMRSRRYAIIDVNNLPDFLVFAAWIPKLQGARIVFDMHEITPEFLISKYGLPSGHWKVRLSAWIERLSMRFADHVLTINEPIQALLETRGLERNKSTIIMNSADESMFFGSAKESKTLLSRPPGAFIMMYHGTLTRIYGLDLALEAFALAQEKMPGAEFWILGRGPEQNSLEALAQNLGLHGKVRFIGTVSPEEIPAWLGQCDIGVLPTRQDVFLDLSFSNKLSEYIIMAKAVIVSRLKTIRHYFSEQALAFSQPNQPDSLAHEMIALFSDPILRARLAERAKGEYAPIAWEVMKNRYLQLMDGLAGVTNEASPLSEEAMTGAASS